MIGSFIGAQMACGGRYPKPPSFSRNPTRSHMKFGPRGSRHALQLQAVVAILDGNFLSPLTYPNAMDQVLNYVEANRSRYLDELKELIAIPSVSTDPQKKGDVARCADWIAAHLRGIGMQTVQVFATAGHPIVYADWLGAPGKPTVLLYGHYDVQPVDPLDLWTSPPFEPIRQDGLLLGRGSSDDKGQIALHWQAIDAWLKTAGELPLNLKVIAEGEEEIGSRHFEEFVTANTDRLRSDYGVVSDTQMVAKGFPAITY